MEPGYLRLRKLYQHLAEACDLYEEGDDLVRDAMIQRFTSNYEQCYYMLTEWLKREGEPLDHASPRTVFRKAFARTLIGEEQTWLRLLADRNAALWLHSERQANEMAERIRSEYLKVFGKLVEKLEEII